MNIPHILSSLVKGGIRPTSITISDKLQTEEPNVDFINEKEDSPDIYQAGAIEPIDIPVYTSPDIEPNEIILQFNTASATKYQTNLSMIPVVIPL